MVPPQIWLIVGRPVFMEWLIALWHPLPMPHPRHLNPIHIILFPHPKRRHKKHPIFFYNSSIPNFLSPIFPSNREFPPFAKSHQRETGRSHGVSFPVKKLRGMWTSGRRSQNEIDMDGRRRRQPPKIGCLHYVKPSRRRGSFALQSFPSLLPNPKFPLSVHKIYFPKFRNALTKCSARPFAPFDSPISISAVFSIWLKENTFFHHS